MLVSSAQVSEQQPAGDWAARGAGHGHRGAGPQHERRPPQPQLHAVGDTFLTLWTYFAFMPKKINHFVKLIIRVL